MWSALNSQGKGVINSILRKPLYLSPESKHPQTMHIKLSLLLLQELGMNSQLH